MFDFRLFDPLEEALLEERAGVVLRAPVLLETACSVRATALAFFASVKLDCLFAPLIWLADFYAL